VQRTLALKGRFALLDFIDRPISNKDIQAMRLDQRKKDIKIDHEETAYEETAQEQSRGWA
jgi:hypothetical protein